MSKQQPKRQLSSNNISSAPNFFTNTNEKRAHSLLNLKKAPSANKPTFQRSKTSLSTGISKFAEDLFNDHITRSLNNFQSIDESHEVTPREATSSQQAGNIRKLIYTLSKTN